MDVNYFFLLVSINFVFQKICQKQMSQLTRHHFHCYQYLKQYVLFKFFKRGFIIFVKFFPNIF
jgi:hypothetical protein